MPYTQLLQEKLHKFAVDPGPRVVARRYDQFLKNIEERDDEQPVYRSTARLGIANTCAAGTVEPELQ